MELLFHYKDRKPDGVGPCILALNILNASRIHSMRPFRKSGGFYIGKVYYDDEGEPKDWTKEDAYQYGVWNSVVDINNDLKLMFEALAKPVLQESGGKLIEPKSNKPTEEEIARWEEESPSRYTQPEEHWANP